MHLSSDARMDFASFDGGIHDVGLLPYSLAASPEVRELSLDFVENKEDMDRLVALATIVKARVPALHDRISELSSDIEKNLQRTNDIHDGIARVRLLVIPTQDEVSHLDAILGRFQADSAKELDRLETKREELCRELKFLTTIAGSFRDKKKCLGEDTTDSAPTCAIAHCFACLTNPVNVAFVPCGHTMCETCSNKLVTSFCPMCRRAQEKKIRLYVSV